MPLPEGKVAPPYVPALTHKLFAVLTRVTATQAEAEPHKMEHINYITGLEAKGNVFGSGPFPVKNEGIDLGLIIFRAGSLEEAEAFMKAEPMTAMGLSTYEIYEWDMIIGHIAVTLNISTGTFTL